jgi:hypothetical protein
MKIHINPDLLDFEDTTPLLLPFLKTIPVEAMCAVVVNKTSCKDRNHPILRGVIVPHQEFFFLAKIMIFLDF